MSVQTARRRARARLVLAGIAGAAGLLGVIGSFQTWISAPTETGGVARVSGWGAISGDSQLTGTDLNDVLAGASTYRPGMLALVFGALAVVAAIVIASVVVPPRPHRIPAVVLALCGVVLAGWGAVRALSPGDAGVFLAGEASAGPGPWLVLVAGVLVLVVAVLVLAGRLDPPRPPERLRRGIQPR
ncbi:hypothetical protein JL107_06115 [Nakamurella flavida]|uniref:Uncharacterized protein n=1 Tax=Nakamurella flavida TaxID=363630 RepID=A0A938YJS9_9ACTN|nr:hypothetical protein [Nakamurella flavida]MBM9476013.1 hypothetical protein [Nakamurella flavida]MDP9777244.1 hypothetical protein [Nakamurella flavida]